MIVDKAYPSSEEELIAFVKKHCDGAESVAVQAGHFLLYYDHTEDLILPAVAEELIDPRHKVISDQVGRFPLLTWQLGLNLLSSIETRQKQIFTLVNDWQYIPSTSDSKRFYTQNRSLFESYGELLNKHSDVALMVLYPDKTDLFGVWGSEKYLRNEYARSIKRQFEEISNGSNVSCDLNTQISNHYNAIYCQGKRPNCVAEVAMLMSRLMKLKVDCFINIFPSVCRAYVEEGTKLARQVSEAPHRILNIAMPSTGIENSKNLFSSTAIALDSLQ